MSAHAYSAKPAVGMDMAFKPDSSSSLAGIPARVTYVWPRFRSGDYLVTLEYAQPVKFRNTLIKHIDAFTSELEPTIAQAAVEALAAAETVEARPLMQRAR
jgi:hypothetical protein